METTKQKTKQNPQKKTKNPAKAIPCEPKLQVKLRQIVPFRFLGVQD